MPDRAGDTAGFSIADEDTLDLRQRVLAHPVALDARSCFLVSSTTKSGPM